MIVSALAELFARDLAKLKQEIAAYPDEAELWRIAGGISNSGGNLCLHLAGNLRHFIGAVLGNTGYVRDREAEFSTRNVPRAELLQAVDESAATVQKVLAELSEERLAEPYPIEVFGKEMSTAFFLMHLHAHLNYHLGQINYHRRLPVGERRD